LPHVVRFNGRECDAWYCELVAATEHESNCPRGATDELANFLRSVATQAGLPDKLESCGVERERLPQLAAAALNQWTATFNPITVDHSALLRLYEAAY
jgi:alcohol dehydrogenase class IV